MYPSASAATPYIFPPPLNATFTTAFWNSPARLNSTRNETDNLLRSAAYDLHRPMFGFGNEMLKLLDNDEIWATWEGDGIINVVQYCLVCKTGAIDGDVWSACENCKSISQHHLSCSMPFLRM
jgi:hypothetical protein